MRELACRQQHGSVLGEAGKLIVKHHIVRQTGQVPRVVDRIEAILKESGRETAGRIWRRGLRRRGVGRARVGRFQLGPVLANVCRRPGGGVERGGSRRKKGAQHENDNGARKAKSALVQTHKSLHPDSDLRHCQVALPPTRVCDP